jgi:hypothetical protein
MRDDLLKAQHYRDQATHLRDLAATDDNDEIRRALISLAESYDHLSLKSLNRAEKAVQEWHGSKSSVSAAGHAPHPDR